MPLLRYDPGLVLLFAAGFCRGFPYARHVLVCADSAIVLHIGWQDFFKALDESLHPDFDCLWLFG